jgi:nicotinamide-nucleotide adenylyltransferase
MTEPYRWRRAAMIARWKPVHLGHQAVLKALLRSAEHVTIGIGSSNKLDVHNPFSAAETREMLESCLGDGLARCEILEVPDLGNGPKWRAMVVELLGTLDAFVTANDWVHRLLEHDYLVVHPVTLLSPEEQVRVSGTMVRARMARGEDWRALVPESTARYLTERDLVARFVRDFGLQTLALSAP